MRENRIPSDDTYDSLSKEGFAGYASKYLCRSWDAKSLSNRADIDNYKKFLEDDSKVGVSMTEQFFFAVKYSFRQDLLEVMKLTSRFLEMLT